MFRLLFCLLVSGSLFGQVIQHEYGYAEASVIDMDVSTSEHVTTAVSEHRTVVKLDLDRRMGVVTEPGGMYLITNLDTRETRSESGKLRVVYQGTMVFDMGTEKEVIKDVMFIMGGDFIEFHLPYTGNRVYCIVYKDIKKYKA